jgi:pimeloyl-ACP methyl ester carboxylesterase
MLALAAAAPLLAQQPQAPARPVESARFTVLLQGRPVGTELVGLSETADGWLITSTNSLAAPFNVETTKFQLRYTRDWKPQSLAIEGLINGQLLTLSTAFEGATATSQGIQAGRPISMSRPVSPGALVAPNGFYAPYEAIAAKLGSAAVGATFPVFVAPQAEVTATVDRIVPHHVTSPGGDGDFRAFHLSLANPGGALAVEVWIDARNRLARIAIPASGLTVLRDDIASVSTRDEPITRPGDEEVFISSTGFNLAGVLSKPSGAAGRLPAVVLIGGSGPTDRDEKVAGIPIFAQIAHALADAGFAVIRYDKRGVGQSGGRIESATLDDYADDAANVVEWLARRRDIDKKRIALVGHSEGGAVALLALKRAKDVAGVGLVAAPGGTGREITLYQQQHLLELVKEPEASRKAKTDLELRILDAVTKGGSWDDVPPELRRQADTPWFRSWLLFDPVEPMKKAKQPMLILQGALDTQVPPGHADRLETLSRSRKGVAPTATRKVIVPGVNHLLVPAKTGEVDEYASLGGSSVSPEVISAIADWLKSVLTTK